MSKGTDDMQRTDIVKVPFYGDVWVSVKRMCANMGLTSNRQLAKLKRVPWATTTMMVVVAEDYKSRDMLMLHLDSVPMWLATIEPSRVREDIRPKLIAYQKECARVLRDHFYGARRNVEEVKELVKEVVREVVKEMVPVFVEVFTSVIRADRQVAIQERTTIGRSGASMINRTIKNIALLVGGDDKTIYRSALSAAHMDLRSALQFSGTGRGWSNLPLAKWPDARAELERMSRVAVRSSKSRQLSLKGTTDRPETVTTQYRDKVTQLA